MTENQRRSKRKARKSQTKWQPYPLTQFEVGQGLAIAENKTFRLALVQTVTKTSAHSIPVTWLEPTSNPLQYKRGPSGTCKTSAFITEFFYKNRRGLVTIPKAHIDSIQSEVVDESEAEEPVLPAKRHRSSSRRSISSKAKVFKKGWFNPKVPDPPVVTRLMWDQDTGPCFGSSLFINNKNLHRAVVTGNHALLKQILCSKWKISRLSDRWSPDFCFTPLMLAICLDDEHSVDQLLKAYESKSLRKATEPTQALSQVQTGALSRLTFGFRVPSVNISRGGREGNNALLQDQTGLPESVDSLCRNKNLTQMIVRGISPKMLEFLSVRLPWFDNQFSSEIGEAVRTGNTEMALYLLKWIKKRGGFGFNALHEEVLKKGRLSPFKKPSVIKKPVENYAVAPLHVACINPDPKHLTELLQVCDEVSHTDSTGRQAVHYAAACTSDAPLKVLQTHGLSLTVADYSKVTPLMISATYNRPAPAAIIAAASANLDFKCNHGLAAIHFAAQHGSLETLKVLVQAGALLDHPGSEGRTALMYAATHGEFECLEYLHTQGARINKRDRRGRSALVFAVKNGFAKEACYLLRHGADFDQADSSKNSPLHYAAAYGWVQCVDLLVRAGANLVCENDWKLQPLVVAVLKHQTEVVIRLLQEPAIDVNCKDDQGRTLVSRAMECLSEETLTNVHMLVVNKGADPNIPDLEKMTAVHHLACQPKPKCAIKELTKEEQRQWEKQAQAWQFYALETLVQSGNADLNALSKKGMTPIFYALSSGNLELAEELLRLGADPIILTGSGDSVLHSYCPTDQRGFKLFKLLLSDTRVAQKCINATNSDGFTPFLVLVKSFISEMKSLWRSVRIRIKAERKEMLLEQKNSTELHGNDSKNSDDGEEEEDQGEDEEEEDDDEEGEEDERDDEDEEEEEDDEEDDDEDEEDEEDDDEEDEEDDNEEDEEDEEDEEEEENEDDDDEPSFGLKGGARTYATKARPKRKFTATLHSGLQSYIESAVSNTLTSEELTAKTKVEFDNIVDEFISLLQQLVSQGADPHAVVQKLKQYRDNPILIYEENIVRLQDSNSSSDDENENSTVKASKAFIIDADGNKLWKEYNEDGLKNALHFLAEYPHPALLDFFLSLGIKVNQQDFYGCTPLTLFVRRKAAPTYVDSLLLHGADPNLLTYQRKSPLHFAVSSSPVLVRELLKYRPALNILSTTNESPLHTVASRRDAELVRELCLAGANPNFLNKDQLTPLHLAFEKAECTADASFELEALLLFHGADINAVDAHQRSPLHYAFVKLGKKKPKRRFDPIEAVSSACSRADINVNAQDDMKRTVLHYAAQHDALSSSMFLLSKGADLNIEDAEGNTALALAFRYRHANYAAMLIQHGASVHRQVHIPPKDKGKLQPGSYSLFRAAVILGWQGVAYLILQNGYDYMTAMQEAMVEAKFRLVRTLLAKVADDSVLTQLNSAQQTLFHTLAIHAQHSDGDTLLNICQQLFYRGVNPDTPDVFQKTPLHYSMKNLSVVMCKFLLENGARLDAVDTEGNTPVSLSVYGENVLAAESLHQNIQEFGASLCFRYFQDGIELTPLLNCLLQKGSPELVKFWLDQGCSVAEQDSKGRNALMYAIMTNSDMALPIIYEQTVDLNHQDCNGFTALHYAVQPFEGYTYENTKILLLLLKAGADWTIQDTVGHSAYYYACQQRSGRLKAELEKAGVHEAFTEELAFSDYSEEENRPNFEHDADAYVRQHPEYKRVVNKGRKPDQQAGGFYSTFAVVDDYDVYMTKADVGRGPYSQQLFYRMQILYESNWEVYLLVTRWGRVWDTGAYQRTPFPDKEQAVREFMKVFHDKTGNQWGDSYTSVKKKYRVIELQTAKVKYKRFLSKIDLEKAAPSHLPAATYYAFKAVTRIKDYSEFLSDNGFSSSALNFGALSEKTFEQAERILLKIEEHAKALELSKETEEMLEIKEKLYNLSSRYFELVPSRRGASGYILPLLRSYEISEQFMTLYRLMNMQIASKILVGSLWNQPRVNPVDYIVSCLPVNIREVNATETEYKLISQYIQSGKGKLKHLKALFRLNRQGEAAQLQHLKNRKLLWQGTPLCNVVGVLAQGLLPPVCNQADSECDNGFVFTNVFVRARKESRSWYSSFKGYFVFLCEVVLGKEKLWDLEESLANCPAGFDSVLKSGSHTPATSVYLNNGIEVPLGPLKTRERGVPRTPGYDHYIVYGRRQCRLRYLLYFENK